MSLSGFINSIFFKPAEHKLSVEELVNRLATELEQEKEKEVDSEIERLAPLLSLKQMERAVDLFFQNSNSLIIQETNLSKMTVVLYLCIARGEDICAYLDEIAFGKESCMQGYAIDILCKMALKKGIRKQRTLELINENLDNFWYETQMPCMKSIGYFENEPLVAEMFKRQLAKIEGHYLDWVNMLRPCGWNYPEIVKGYFPLLKTIILHSDKQNYSLLEMAGTLSSMDGGEMKAYDKDGNEYTADEGIEANKLNGAAIYYNIDKTDDEVNAFIEKVAANSKFEKNKRYAESILKPKN